ncbi:MAG: putative rRNA methylase [Paenibacillus sp.]|nr:putative rRNA methylase [Paenibacillus sp.]
MGFLSVLSFAHRCVGERLRPGDIAIDATAGTGADTAFLCSAVGRTGKIYAFDIQQEALDRTAERINRLPEAPQLHLLLTSHAELLQFVPEREHGRVGAVMFNLGYLPGGDPHIMTKPDTTITALDAALLLLKPGGIVSITLYPGHEGGRQEADRVERWAESLASEQYQTVMYRFMNRNNPPYIIAVEKRKV